MADEKQVDVVIAWNFASIPKSMRSGFERRTAFIDLPTPAGRKYRDQLAGFGWPYPIRTLLRNRLAKGEYPARIMVMGFSESVSGIGWLLTSKDVGLIDTIIACDGIHCGFIGGEPNRDRTNLDMSMLSRWVAFAKLAARLDAAEPPGQRHLIITHSSIGDQLYPPYKFASTTRTAATILDHAFGPGKWPEVSLPSGVIDVDEAPPYVAPAGRLPEGQHYPRVEYNHSPDKYHAGASGLIVLGYNNLDPTGVGDHKYQAQRVLPRVVQKLLIDRWNKEDPNRGVCTGTVSSGGEDSSESCTTWNPNGVTVPQDIYEGRADLGLTLSGFPPSSAPEGAQAISTGSRAGAVASLLAGAFAGWIGARAWQQR